ncbi:hypothetical protein [Cystobacter fuscus]|uniref:hypothetical protein n=1 Tax=Cystobacter fuscus TaxID=43 RepID=UPI0005BC2326|nr:hypothetical protein [Cystobacter fuscus]
MSTQRSTLIWQEISSRFEEGRSLTASQLEHMEFRLLAGGTPLELARRWTHALGLGDEGKLLQLLGRDRESDVTLIAGKLIGSSRVLALIARDHAAFEERDRFAAAARHLASTLLNGPLLGDRREVEFYRLQDVSGRSREALARVEILTYPFSFEGWVDPREHVLLHRNLVLLDIEAPDWEDACRAEGIVPNAGTITRQIIQLRCVLELVSANGPFSTFHFPGERLGRRSGIEDVERFLCELTTWVLFATAPEDAGVDTTLWRYALQVFLRRGGAAGQLWRGWVREVSSRGGVAMEPESLARQAVMALSELYEPFLNSPSGQADGHAWHLAAADKLRRQLTEAHRVNP